MMELEAEYWKQKAEANMRIAKAFITSRERLNTIIKNRMIVDRVKRNHLKEKALRNTTLKMDDDVRARAREWWGTEGDPPIDMADMRTGECGFVPMDEVKK